jgi:integral membrane protein (TIGR01906 family)
MILLKSISRIVIPIFTVFFILFTSILLLFNPIFLTIEYQMPNFPPDPYGFTQKDRLHWSRISVEYLINDSDITFLEKQHLPDGSPLYNERELKHMLDVKRLVQAVIVGWIILTVALAVTCGLAYRAKWLVIWGKAVSWGGWITDILLISIFAAIFTSFDALFTGFHHIFFTGDTWLFLYSDTLIRLFPMKFWQDGFIAVGSISIIFATLAGFLARKLPNQ